MTKQKLNLILLIIIFGLLLILSGCENISELEEIISYQNNRIVELEEQLENQIQLNVSNQNEIELLNQEIEMYQTHVPEWQTILADDLMENVKEITIEFLGGDPQIDNKNDILFPTGGPRTRGYIVARLAPMRPATYVILSYQVVNEEGEFVSPHTINWENSVINWELVGHVTLLSGLRVVEEIVPRHLTDLDRVTIRIYYPFDWDDEEWRYREEVIAGEELWQEVVDLMPEVRDLWYEDETLYVDLFASEWLSAGGMQDLLTSTRLRYIFSSFPHVSEIRFLTEGQIGLPFFGYGPEDIMHIVDVENNRWLFLCDLAEDDPFFVDEERWGSHIQVRRERLCEGY